MRAIVCRGWGELESLRLEELPSPPLRPRTIRIGVRACGANFADVLLTRGEYQEKPPFPFSPGMEVSGVVLEVGEAGMPGDKLDGFEAGDRVLAFLDHGGYAEEVVVNVADTTRLPETMSFAEAAGFPVAYGTSHLALRHRADLRPGETLLVHGASGGVGLTAVEIGKALGATVIATASTAGKLQIASDHGADHLINYATEDIRERVLALTEGVDVVYDPVGGDAFTASLRCINPGGRILVIGFASGTVPQIPANHLLVKDASVLGLSLGQLRHHRPEVVHEAMTEALSWYAEGKLRPLVSATFDLADAPQAMALLRDRKATGKVVVLVGDGAEDA
ncbi:MAG TPA: NADPH:quinone oxidoreductase family protein [Dehalococcoidia bacterium]|jgi:NADPH2:quinone reductase|nr:NADPH:quinone oxidoreductase family protein [Dehalococcoidia bacterium]